MGLSHESAAELASHSEAVPIVTWQSATPSATRSARTTASSSPLSPVESSTRTRADTCQYLGLEETNAQVEPLAVGDGELAGDGAAAATAAPASAARAAATSATSSGNSAAARARDVGRRMEASQLRRRRRPKGTKKKLTASPEERVHLPGPSERAANQRPQPAWPARGRRRRRRSGRTRSNRARQAADGRWRSACARLSGLQIPLRFEYKDRVFRAGRAPTTRAPRAPGVRRPLPRAPASAVDRGPPLSISARVRLRRDSCPELQKPTTISFRFRLLAFSPLCPRRPLCSTSTRQHPARSHARFRRRITWESPRVGALSLNRVPRGGCWTGTMHD